MKKILIRIPSRFPLTDRPYREMAEKIGMNESELIAVLKDMKETGIVRRVCGVLAHRKAAYTCNAMVVWRVDEEDMEKTGAIMASFPEVSHCYERDTGGYWAYNLYTMVHGRLHEECADTIKRIAGKTV
jgi:DNA-binding Lrp family transcriptional regulator